MLKQCKMASVFIFAANVCITYRIFIFEHQTHVWDLTARLMGSNHIILLEADMSCNVSCHTITKTNNILFLLWLWTIFLTFLKNVFIIV